MFRYDTVGVHVILGCKLLHMTSCQGTKINFFTFQPRVFLISVLASAKRVQIDFQVLYFFCLLIQAAVIRQDSILELCLRDCSTPCSAPPTPTSVPLGPSPVRLSRSLSRDALLEGMSGGAGEYVLLQRQFSLLQEEVGRLRPLESRLRDSEKARIQLETQLREQLATRCDNTQDSTDTATTQQVRFNVYLYS